MERLTEKHYLATDHYMRCSEFCNEDMDCIDCPAFDRLVERLAAYEDTGLTPEQCENAKAIIESAFSDDTSKAERIRELLKADKDGRLVVLPCKVGDTVYKIFKERTKCSAYAARGCRIEHAVADAYGLKTFHEVDEKVKTGMKRIQVTIPDSTVFFSAEIIEHDGENRIISRNIKTLDRNQLQSGAATMDFISDWSNKPGAR